MGAADRTEVVRLKRLLQPALAHDLQNHSTTSQSCASAHGKKTAAYQLTGMDALTI